VLCRHLVGDQRDRKVRNEWGRRDRKGAAQAVDRPVGLEALRLRRSCPLPG
jgi:hypothetical protein